MNFFSKAAVFNPSPEKIILFYELLIVTTKKEKK